MDIEQVPPGDHGAPVTDMGWEIYPQGLHELLLRLHVDYDAPVLYVLENGMSSPDVLTDDGAVHDEARIRFLTDHLTQLHRAIEDGVDVRGYFAWTDMDNFEWEEGWTQRFGLIHVDHRTLQRTVKDSGHWYATFINGANRTSP